ncbi:MAG: SRPBCC domain-containing protein [Phycisphaerales bacterium]
MPASPPARAGKVLRKEAFYNHPPEVVWAALTSGEALAQWLMPNNFPGDPRVGSRFQFRIDPMPMLPSHTTDCEIVEFDPPRRMVWTWKMVSTTGKRDLPAMRMEWLLTPERDGTRLTFTQSNIDALPFIYKLMMSFGWGTMMMRWLPMVLNAFEPTPDGARRYHRLAKPGNRGHHGTKTLPPEFFK